MTTDLLRKLLPEFGYAVVFRKDQWTECFASLEGERWRGRGLDEDDALADVLRQMFPSSLARLLLASQPNGCAAIAPAAEIPPPAPDGGSEEPGPASAVSSAPFTAAARSDRGSAREHGEDACLALPERGLLAVAGGLGAGADGDVAAAMAIEAIRRAFESEPVLLPIRGKALPLLLAAIAEANAEVFKAGQREPALRGMGTTLAAALVVGRQVVLAHVGDSRIYRLRRGVLALLTTDHPLTTQRRRAGQPAGTGRAQVTRLLGARRAVEADTSVTRSQPGDTLLLCTGGLHRAVGHEDLGELLDQHKDPEAAVAHLVARARAMGECEDVTAAVLRWEA